VPEPKPKPPWAGPTHYVVATKCGQAKKGERLTRDLDQVSCRFCLMAVRQEAESKRKGGRKGE
jgi:hypothetical protein